MNGSLFISISIKIFFLIVKIDCYPRRILAVDSQHTLPKYQVENPDGCFPGQCVHPWNCPSGSETIEPTSSCSHWRNGPWVCCILNNDDTLYYPLDNHEHSAKCTERHVNAITESYPPRTAKKSWGSESFMTEKDLWQTTSSPEQSKKRHAQPTAVISLGDLPINSWERPNLAGSWHKSTKFPSLDGWMKTTISDWDEWTASSYHHNSRTTKYETTSDPRIVFPTESESWTKKTTKLASPTSRWRKTTKFYEDKTTSKLWSLTTEKPWIHSTSKSPTKSTTKLWVHSTSKQPTKSTIKSSWTHSTPKTTTKSTTNPWPHSTSKPPIKNSTKSWNHSTSKPWTHSTEKSWVHSTFKSTMNSRPPRTTQLSTKTHRGTTESSVKPNTRRTRTPSTTRIPTTSFKVTNNWWSENDERRDSVWGNSRKDSPATRSSTISSSRAGTTRSSTIRSTAKSRNRSTTPLPDVNTYLCGIRDERSLSNRRSLNSRGGDEVSYSGSNQRGRQSFQRIVGGEEADPYSWPWVAALYKVSSSGVNRFLSAGSLINENFVLTAAHPFTRDDLRSASYVVMLGTHNAQDAVAEYKVSSVIQHPTYEQRYYYHDLALLRLERPVVFNDFVMPVCLPSPDAPLLRDRDLEGKNVTVMGWGDDSYGGKSSRVLKEATFPVLSRRSCNASYVRVASNRFPKGITENMLCAGDPRGGKDACQGDSGGPLTYMERGRYTQVGIVSFGFKCGDKEYPGVYTKVAPYLGWIAEQTQRVQDKDYFDYEYRG